MTIFYLIVGWNALSRLIRENRSIYVKIMNTHKDICIDNNKKERKKPKYYVQEKLFMEIKVELDNKIICESSTNCVAVFKIMKMNVVLGICGSPTTIIVEFTVILMELKCIRLTGVGRSVVLPYKMETETMALCIHRPSRNN
jgi:hypothetical protein